MGFAGAAAVGLGSDEGAAAFGFSAVFGTIGLVTSGASAEPPPFGLPTRDAGALALLVPGVFGAPGAPGEFGAAPPGGVVAGRFCGASLALGLGAPGVGPIAAGGAGGAPFVPGTGNALAFGRAALGGSALAFGSAALGGSALGVKLAGDGVVGPPF
jgi:hypothetical protein